MANEYLVKGTDLTAIADAIREKAGIEDSLAFPNGFVCAVEGIGGSSGYKTCTIKVVCGSGIESFRLCDYVLTCVNNGEIQANAASVYESGKTEVVFENVLCGSAVYMYTEESSGMTSTTVSDNMTTFDDFCVFAAPTQSGAVGVITVESDDV